VSATFEVCGQESFDDFQSWPGVGDLSPEAQNIGIVVLASSLRGKHITAQGCPYALYFVSGYAHTYACAAY
jgi:hypothetical protein